MIGLALLLATALIAAPLVARRAGRRAVLVVAACLAVPFAAMAAWGAVLLFGTPPCPDGRLYGDGCGTPGPVEGLIFWGAAFGLAMLGIGVAVALARTRGTAV